MSGNWGEPWAGTIRHTLISSSSSRWRPRRALGSSDWSHMPVDIRVEPISLASCVWPDPSHVVIEYYTRREAGEEKEDREREKREKKRACATLLNEILPTPPQMDDESLDCLCSQLTIRWNKKWWNCGHRITVNVSHKANCKKNSQ